MEGRGGEGRGVEWTGGERESHRRNHLGGPEPICLVAGVRTRVRAAAVAAAGVVSAASAEVAAGSRRGQEESQFQVTLGGSRGAVGEQERKRSRAKSVGI